METIRTDAVVAALGADLPEAVADALDDLRPSDLRDPTVLTTALRLCLDERELPPRFGPKREPDPFATFFGGDEEKRGWRVCDHAGDVVADRGVPGTPVVAGAIGEALAGARTPPLLACAARLLGATHWEDEVAAVEAIVPALLAADTSLFEALPALGAAGVGAVVDLALSPFRARAINEALNHPKVGAHAAARLRAALEGGAALSDREAMEALALLVAWSPPDATKAALVLEKTRPWAVAFAAVEDPRARERFGRWLAGDAEGVELLADPLLRALGSRRPMPDFPLAALLARSDSPAAIGVVVAWKATAACADLLREWVRGGAADPDRAWDAITLLVSENAHGDVLDDIEAALHDAPFDGELFLQLAEADPPIPCLLPFLVSRALEQPDRLRDVGPALLACAGDAHTDVLRGFAEAWLTIAEQAPLKRIPQRRGVVKVVRDGMDVDALEPLVDRVASGDLRARLLAVAPQLEQR